MGVAAAYLGEIVTEELKTAPVDRVVVVAPQEGQVSMRWESCAVATAVKKDDVITK